MQQSHLRRFSKRRPADVLFSQNQPTSQGTVRVPADHRPIFAIFKTSQGSPGTFSEKLKLAGARTIFL